jgi:hypothetical protein
MSTAQFISWRQRVLSAWLTVLILASSYELNTALAVSPTEDAESIERGKLSEFGLPGDLRRRLDSALMAEINEIDRNCQLTPEQRKKLRLMGQGDIHHFFNLLRASRTTPDAEVGADILLRLLVEGGLFHESSLFFKSIPNILDANQLVLHAPRVKKARQERQQAATKMLLDAFDGEPPLTASERNTLTALFNEIGPAGNNGQGAAIYLALQLGVMLEKSGDRFPNEKCRQKVKELAKQVKSYEPVLRRAGYFPPEHDSASAEKAAPGRSNKQ